MEKLSLQEIVKAVDGKMEGAESADPDILSVSTDTRKISPGSLFIPIKGERFDGHDFIEAAYAAGAAAVLSEIPVSGHECVVTVSDTRKAYLDLASYYRRRFPVTVVGVTGSVGKTTTKEMIADVLESQYHTLKTEGNLNNEIGLPATLLQLDSSYRAAVIEMGMSAFGEISRLSRCAAPNISVITNIGESHIEYLGSREGILKAKLEILDGMDSHAPLILNADNDLLAGVINDLAREMIYYGIDNPNAEIRAIDIVEQNMTTKFDILYYGKTIHAVIPTVGKHNVLNALAAFTVGFVLDIAPEQIVEALSRYVPSGMRQKIVNSHGIIFIEDCYNASPDSMKASIGVLSSVSCTGKRIAVLADMLELGEHSAEAHERVGRMVAQSNADMLYCFGKQSKNMLYAAQQCGMKDAYWFDDKKRMAREIRKNIATGDCILFKGSRGMRLEEVIYQIYRES